MLSQVDLMDEMLQMAFVATGANSFKDGKRTSGKGSSPLYKHMGDTYLAFETFIRQMYVEEIIRNAYERCGGRVMMGWALQGLTIDRKAADSFRINAVIKDETGATKTVRRYCLTSGRRFID